MSSDKSNFTSHFNPNSLPDTQNCKGNNTYQNNQNKPPNNSHSNNQKSLNSNTSNYGNTQYYGS